MRAETNRAKLEGFMVLSKLQRRHDRDLKDVRSFLQSGLIEKDRLWEMYHQIEKELVRYPGVDAASFRAVVSGFCHDS